MTTTADVMNFIVANKGRNLGNEVIADLFDRMVWIFDDNGAQLNQVRREWLAGEDVEKIDIALRMEGLFPYDDRQSMQDAFERIVKKWPHFRAACERIEMEWRRDVERE